MAKGTKRELEATRTALELVRTLAQRSIASHKALIVNLEEIVRNVDAQLSKTLGAEHTP